jgi:hypothetical protein
LEFLSPAIGDALDVTVTVESLESEPARFVVAAAVHFVKADGTTRAKVFKLRTVTLAPGEAGTVSRRVSVRQHTTRTHHPGRHRVAALVNGAASDLGHVDLRA